MCLGNSLTARNSSENAEKSEFGAYILTNVTSCESAWTSVIWYFPLQFDLVKMCLKFTLLLTGITTSCNWRASENRLLVQSNFPPAIGAFPGNNTLKLVTTEIGQNVFSIVANIPLMPHSLSDSRANIFFRWLQEQQLLKRNDQKKGKLAGVDGGALRSSPNYQTEKPDLPRGPRAPNSVLLLSLVT